VLLLGMAEFRQKQRIKWGKFYSAVCIFESLISMIIYTWKNMAFKFIKHKLQKIKRKNTSTTSFVDQVKDIEKENSIIHWEMSRYISNSIFWKKRLLDIFLNFIIHMCIQSLGHFSPMLPPPPLPPTLPPPSPPNPLNTQQKLFCPYF
jgi:hypothetical protein